MPSRNVPYQNIQSDNLLHISKALTQMGLTMYVIYFEIVDLTVKTSNIKIYKGNKNTLFLYFGEISNYPIQTIIRILNLTYSIYHTYSYFQNQLIHIRMGLLRIIQKWIKYYEIQQQEKEKRSNIGTNKGYKTALILYFQRKVKITYSMYQVINE